jgi:hypothetical protein
LNAEGFLWLLLILGAFIAYKLSTMLPSDLGISIGVGGGAIFAIFFVVQSESSIKDTDPSIHKSGPLQQSKLTMWGRIIFTFSLVLFFGIPAFSLGYPYGYTHFFGKKASRTAIVSGTNFSFSSRDCPKLEIANSPVAIGGRTFCVSRDTYLITSTGTSLMLIGRESVFGFNVEKILLSNPGIFDTPGVDIKLP